MADISVVNSNDPKPEASSQDLEKNPAKDYFATKSKDEIGSQILKRAEDYYDYLQKSGRFSLWKRSFEYYYQGRVRGGKIGRIGKEEEFYTLPVNHYRNIGLHMRNNCTAQRPAYEPRATNSDYDSQAQCIVGSGILDYYEREKNIDDLLKKATESAIFLAEGEIFVEWDATIGPDYAPNQESPGKTVKQGDVTVEAFFPMDVIRDPSVDDASKHTWKIVRRYKNKYDLAAKYPDLASKILSLSKSAESKLDTRLGVIIDVESDQICQFTLYHAKTDAVPQGRLVDCLSADIVLTDGPLPYDGIPGYRITADEEAGTGFGYTILYDLLAIQEAIHGLYSTVMTNQATFGVQNVMAPRGSGVTVMEILGGMNLIEYDPQLGKPEALNLTHTPKEIFDFMVMLEHLMETLSGINSVARGNPEASLKSGAALALVAAQAIQFSSGLQRSYARLLEDVGTAIIKILQTFANTPRIALIVGKQNRPLLDSFSNEDIAKISRVTVDMGNPLSRTTAGKIEIANTLLQNHLITTPDEYLMVLQTGRLEPMIEGQTSELLLIKRENEYLRDGKKVQAIMTDNHVLHIQENKTVLSSPEAREKPEVLAAALDHLQQHINLLKQMDPVTATLLKQPALAPPQLPPPPDNGTAGAPAKKPGGPPPVSPGEMNAENPDVAAGAGVAMPNMPTNPVSGNKFNEVNGGQ